MATLEVDNMEYSTPELAQTAYVTNATSGATGGTITTDGNYTVHTFTSSGTFTPFNSGNAEILIVAGGGAGGNRHGGGGGGGGVIHIPVATLTATAYTVTVGNGAPTNTAGTDATGQNGSDSVFSGDSKTETASGGGGGGAYTGHSATNGGGGGGGRGESGTPPGGSGVQSVTNDFGSATGYAYNGGMGNVGGEDERIGGGGGGAGGAGTGITGTKPTGGAGHLNDISGTSYYYSGGGGGGVWSSAVVAGNGGTGGGGGGGSANAGGAGTGGTGGSANGFNGDTSANGGAGGVNTGGGGGGSGQANYGGFMGNGGAGGSGIVIIRYLTSSQSYLGSFSESTIKTQGSYALKIQATQTYSLNKTLIKTFSSNQDLSGVNTLKLDMRASRTGTNVKLGLHDTGGTTTEITPTIITADTYETKTWDLSAVADSDKNAIDTFTITPTNADAANTIYLDNFEIAQAIDVFGIIT